jgi:hypothetical protein
MRGSVTVAASPPWLYVPWLREHGDALIGLLAATGDVRFAPVHLFPPEKPLDRRHAALFARLNPRAFAGAVEQRLLRAAPSAAGLVVTFDWAPSMRIVVSVAKAHGLPVVLIPHEGAFFDRRRFYANRNGEPRAPIADAALVWGELHKEIFIERGYPAARIQVVGSPKVAAARRYRPLLDATAYRTGLGLAPDRPVVLFALQPLDNVADPDAARAVQRRIVAETAEVTAAAGYGLVLRLPPAPVPDLVPPQLGSHVVVAKPGREPAGSALEAIAQASLVVSMGSTMLLEAATMKRPALVLTADGFESSFSGLGIPAARSRAEMAERIPALVEREEVVRLAGEASGRMGLAENEADPAQRVVAILRTLAYPQPLDQAAPLFGASRRRGKADALQRFAAFEALGMPPKMRKLLLNPAGYLRDSRLAQYIRRPASS